MKHDSYLKIIYRFFDLIILTFLVFDFGYSIKQEYNLPKLIGLVSVVFALLAFNIFKFYYYKTSGRKKVALANVVIIAILLLVSLIIILNNTHLSLVSSLELIRPILEGGLVIYFVIRLMILVRYIYNSYNNPAIVFVGSFFSIILIGAFLLLLPNATTKGISFTDALFTSTSAVCVTGLTVLDTSKDFTTVGQTIILFLIQIGGLGILTFTSFFSYFFRGSSSFKEGLNVKDFISQDNLKDVLKTALNVVAVTLIIECIGAILLYFTVANHQEIKNKVFFSFFHSISAFCNAGFSLFSGNLNEPVIKFNYFLQWIIMLLIIMGGLGHNIIFNFYQYTKCKLSDVFYKKVIHKEKRIITLNTKIVLYTTGILLLGGAILLYIFEYFYTLQEHDTFFGKITAAFFHSVTPRTAGFNATDYTLMATPSILLVIFLMWIGGSPASTAGGIKTSTFAISILNIFATARGKSRIQLFGRRLSAESTSRAFAIMCISLILIGFAIVLLIVFEPKNTDLLTIVFECFSAYGTVGLSLNFTPYMTEPSKYVIIFAMFIGRIGMLNLLVGLLKEINHQFYEYPKENILIN